MKDPDNEKQPPLRISHIVYGRESDGKRVLYLLDPKGEGNKKGIAEQVVLHRWRKRVFQGYAFGGARLSPNLWRALLMVLGPNADGWDCYSMNELKTIIESKRDLLRTKHLTVPTANVLFALIKVCGTDGLQKLVNRHNDPERMDRYGVPDLFLYATNNESGLPTIARFVEVKKPDEPVSRDQREEIAFLQSLGLHARVLRLIERA
jgi:hypothetical protein